MKINTIINRYIFKELVSPFCVSLVFLNFIFLMTRIPDIINMIVNYNTEVLSVLLLIVYSLPRFLEFTIPMSLMISIILTFMRLSRDNEIIALKGAGITIYKLFIPVLIFSFLSTCLTIGITVWAVPFGKFSFKKKSIEIVQSNLNIVLEPQRFNNRFNDVMIYLNSIDINTKQFKDIFIQDNRIKERVTISLAPRGIIISDLKRNFYTLRLYKGIINQVNLKDRSVNTINFDMYDINLDLKNIGKHGKVSKDFDEMSLKELLKFIKKDFKNKADLNSALIEFHEKFSIPFACLALGILSLPLGLFSLSSKHSSGFGLGLFFFILYYLLLSAGWSLGEAGFYPPFFAMWTPNFIIAGIGIWFIIRVANEDYIKIPHVIKILLIKYKK
ncbi:MAG: LPS export ABC transporter permease LptF [Desulfobacteraceae bacterium 4572_130]|nr:MAG: LPS export ABC transporter permease LptF [Desulfobacteraceae bacterium 4572_130]